MSDPKRECARCGWPVTANTASPQMSIPGTSWRHVSNRHLGVSPCVENGLPVNATNERGTYAVETLRTLARMLGLTVTVTPEAAE